MDVQENEYSDPSKTNYSQDILNKIKIDSILTNRTKELISNHEKAALLSRSILDDYNHIRSIVQELQKDLKHLWTIFGNEKKIGEREIEETKEIVKLNEFVEILLDSDYETFVQYKKKVEVLAAKLKEHKSIPLSIEQELNVIVFKKTNFERQKTTQETIKISKNLQREERTQLLLQKKAESKKFINEIDNKRQNLQDLQKQFALKKSKNQDLSIKIHTNRDAIMKQLLANLHKSGQSAIEIQSKKCDLNRILNRKNILSLKTEELKTELEKTSQHTNILEQQEQDLQKSIEINNQLRGLNFTLDADIKNENFTTVMKNSLNNLLELKKQQEELRQTLTNSTQACDERRFIIQNIRNETQKLKEDLDISNNRNFALMTTINELKNEINNKNEDATSQKRLNELRESELMRLKTRNEFITETLQIIADLTDNMKKLELLKEKMLTTKVKLKGERKTNFKKAFKCRKLLEILDNSIIDSSLSDAADEEYPIKVVCEKDHTLKGILKSSNSCRDHPKKVTFGTDIIYELY